MKSTALTHYASSFVHRVGIPLACLTLAVCALGLLSGCETSQRQTSELDPSAATLLERASTNESSPSVGGKTGGEESRSIILREGDVIKVMFPSAANLNTVQPVRRDGKITLQMVGEINAVGLTPKELEAEILKAYAGQLLTKEVTVMVDSSTYPVFVTGAVLRPGKVMADRPLTALEAIMEAGGFDYSKANMKKVQVIRREGGKVQNFRLNLKAALDGKSSDTFNVKTSDIIYVPERFTWF